MPKKLKPKLPQKEATHLTPPEAKRLLESVRGKPYEVAVWLGVLGGRRIGEIQALKWSNVDLSQGLIFVRSTYVRKEKVFRDYPKGKKWQTIQMPPELWELMRREKQKSRSEYVVTSENGEFLSYHTFQKALKRYCREAGVKALSTHGLRHSCSEIYMENGASRDDLRMLYNHSTSAVTDVYIHDKGERVGKVAQVIRLFPNRPHESRCSQNVPKLENG